MTARLTSRLARLFILFTLLSSLFTLLLAACGAPDDPIGLPTPTPPATATPTPDPDATPTPEPTPPPTPTPRPALPGGALADVVAVELATPVIDEETGHVHLELVVTSLRDTPFTLVAGGLMANFAVSRDGEEVWRPTITTAALYTHQFQPGEERRFTRVWELVDNDDQPVEPGAFTVRGVFTAATSMAMELDWQVIETEEQALVITEVTGEDEDPEEGEE